MSLGSGLTVCDKNRVQNNDYLKVAHIGYGRKITYYTQALTLDALSAIEDFAVFKNTSVSTTQKDRYCLRPLDYTQFSLERLELLLNDFEQYYWSHEGKYEFDYYLNDISRAIIHKYDEKNGSCYLGIFKKDEGETTDLSLVKYEGQYIHEFQFDFIVPCYDEKLMNLISSYNKVQLPKNPNKMQYLIYKRIFQLNGLFLLWTNKPQFLLS